MDIPQLKLLAARVRDLLQQSECTIGHNQSLDAIAALPGLRNWPEVQAFPDRVSACELDEVSTGRLSFRLRKKFEVELSPKVLLAALRPEGAALSQQAPQIWPTGPAPGVYITTSQDAINALLERYEEATDGALVYAEEAGSHWNGSIDLGERGLSSPGLGRVPSGTLIVVGPVELDQQSWERSAERLEMAALDAQYSGHRVAVLVSTPAPASVFEDVLFMVKSVEPEGDNAHEALIGEISESGEMKPRTPFATGWPPLSQARSEARPNGFPSAALPALTAALKANTTGLVLFGSEVIEEHPAIDLVAASLSLTEHVGPAARIMPRHRSTPSKDWDVPDAIARLPLLPSIESAYEQGYRRMVIASHYTKGDVLNRFAEKVLFIGGTYSGDIARIFIDIRRATGMLEASELLSKVVSILGVAQVPGRHATEIVSDLYVRKDRPPLKVNKHADIDAFFQANRTLRWEDEISRLLKAEEVTTDAVKEALSRSRSVDDLLTSLVLSTKEKITGL